MESIDKAVVFKLNRSSVAFRKRVSGQVESSASAGGFYVQMKSFQGEQESHSDVVSAFTDASGSFSLAILPDATYCAYALASHWVGDIVDLIPYQSAADLTTAPSLTVSEGQEVEITVTTGPQKKPLPVLTIYLLREHQLTWEKDGKTQHGMSGPQWWAETDVTGRAIVRAIPGKLKASVHTLQWQTEQSIDVVKGQPAKILIHRDAEN